MASPTLLLDATLAIGMAALFAYVGVVVQRRPTSSPEALQALRAFVTWWWGLSILTAMGAARTLSAAAGALDVGFHRGLTYLSLAPLVAALWGLVAYLVYVQTGSTRWRMPILVLHGAIGMFFVLLIAWLHPIGVEAGAWAVEVQYEHELTGALLVATIVVLLAPALIAAALYFALFFRVRDPVSRYRIGMVAGAILLWFGSAAVGAAVEASDWYWWPLVSRAISLVSTLMILLAYKPPRPLRLRLEASRARLAKAEDDRPATRVAPPGQTIEGVTHGRLGDRG